MPTILMQEGYSFTIWPGDHLPPHVHVFKAGTEIIILLETLEIREAYGMAARDQKRAHALATQNQKLLIAAWEEIHG